MTAFRSLPLLLPLLLCCSCVTRTSSLVFRYAQPTYTADMEDLAAGKGTLYTDGKEQYVELPRYRVHSSSPVVGTIDDFTRTRRTEEGRALYHISHCRIREYSGIRQGKRYYSIKPGTPPRLDERGTKHHTLAFSLIPAEEAETVKARCTVRPLRQAHIKGRHFHREDRWYTPAVYAAGIPLLLCVDMPLTVAENICMIPLIPVIALWPDPEGPAKEDLSS